MSQYQPTTLRIYMYCAYRGAKHTATRACVFSEAAQKHSGLLQLRGDGGGCCGPGRLFVCDAALRRELRCRQVCERWMRRCKLFPRGLLQRNSEFFAPADEPPDGPMRLAKRHSFRRQEIREIRRQREAAGGLPHALFIEVRRAEHLREHGEHGEHGIHGVEERLLVFLQVLRVTER